jgi:hypothetical protein
MLFASNDTCRCRSGGRVTPTFRFDPDCGFAGLRFLIYSSSWFLPSFFLDNPRKLRYDHPVGRIQENGLDSKQETKQVSFRLPCALHLRLKVHAAKASSTIEATIRTALENHLRKQPNGTPPQTTPP